MNLFKPLHYKLFDKYIHNSAKLEISKYAKGKVLDIGCGDKPFYSYIKNQIDLYIGIEYPQKHHSNKNIEIFAAADKLPIKSHSFSFIIISQVLEHLENPLDALKEINRILINDGRVFVSWPFLYLIHEEPRDFYRFTKYGMTYLAEQAGLTIEYITPTTGFWITIFCLLSKHLLTKSKILYRLFVPVLLIIKYICLGLDKIDHKFKYKCTLNYNALLRK